MEIALRYSSTTKSEKRKKHAVVEKKKINSEIASESSLNQIKYKEARSISVETTITIVVLSIERKNATRAQTDKNEIIPLDTIFRFFAESLLSIVTANNNLDYILFRVALNFGICQ